MATLNTPIYWFVSSEIWKMYDHLAHKYASTVKPYLNGTSSMIQPILLYIPLLILT